MVMIQDTFMIMVLIEHVKGLQIRFDNASQPFSSSVACACPGDQLLFDCSVADGVATIWRGKALNCHGVSNSIILRHSRFNLSEPAAGECNDRIVAHSIGVSDTFISQLSVNVTEEMNNKTIECVRDANGTTDGYEIAGTTTVAVVTAGIIK